MHEPLNSIINLFFRWLHVIAGITWALFLGEAFVRDVRLLTRVEPT